MNDIIALTTCLAPHLSGTTLRQLRHLMVALLCISGRVTTLGLSRWSEKGGSYRTLQRCMQTPLDWGMLLWTVVRVHLLNPHGQYVLAGDEVVVSKAGERTHGLGRFYSSLAQRPIPALSFLALALVDVQQRRSYPLYVQQRVPAKRAETAALVPKRGRGRPKGSKNHVKAAPTLTPELSLLGTMLRTTLARITLLPVQHLVLDGFFGTSSAAWTVRDCGLHLISKLRHNAALYLPYTGSKPRRGPTPRYGHKLDYAHLPADACVHTTTTGQLVTHTYQLTVLHKEFADPLNLVIIVKTNLRTHKRAQVLLFSTDVSLSAEQIIDFYSLRFQIEFNFRDAKQYWGLEDFMNVTPTAVTNAANLAMLMVNVSAVLLRPHRQHQPDFSVLDLKSHYRAGRYLDETINSLPGPPAPHLIARLRQRFSALGSIRPPSQLQDVA